MARQIRIDQISGYMGEQVQLLVKATTLEWDKQVKRKTPKITGVLSNGWQADVSQPYVGTITNRIVYAEAVCFGTNLPPSWNGQPKSSPPPGFPELIGKELEGWAQKEYRRIVARG
jgi:hypothetical protein